MGKRVIFLHERPVEVIRYLEPEQQYGENAVALIRYRGAERVAIRHGDGPWSLCAEGAARGGAAEVSEAVSALPRAK